MTVNPPSVPARSPGPDNPINPPTRLSPLTDTTLLRVTFFMLPPIASPSPAPTRSRPLTEKLSLPCTETLSTVNARYDATPSVVLRSPATLAVPKDPAIPPT